MANLSEFNDVYLGGGEYLSNHVERAKQSPKNNPALPEMPLDSHEVKQALISLGYNFKKTDKNLTDNQILQREVVLWQKRNDYPMDGNVLPAQIAKIKEQSYLALRSSSMNHTDEPLRPSDNKWSISIEKTGAETSSENHLVATGKIVLTEPNGLAHSFPFRSGGFGKYGDDSMLPGLNKDLTSPLDQKNASYEINWKKFYVNVKWLPNGVQEKDGTGSWLELGSDREQTDRGGVINKSKSGFFGIHPDGSNGKSSGNDGSKGCIAITTPDSKRLFKMLASIPKDQRPDTLIVKPETKYDPVIKASLDLNTLHL